MDILTAVLGVISAIATIIAIYEKHMAKKAKKAREKEEHLVEIMKKLVHEKLEQQTKEILESVERNYISVTDDEDCRKEFREEITHIKNLVQTLDTKNDERDRAYIRQEILYFAKRLREGEIIGELEYKNVLEFYDYYKNKLKGNSYIDDEMAYIKKEMRKR